MYTIIVYKQNENLWKFQDLKCEAS